MKNPIIISLGGSLIVPNEIDISFLKSFKELIEAQVAQGKKFVIIAGGGKTCRQYQTAAGSVVTTSKEDLDWIGISATKMNAELLRVIFADIAHSSVIVDDGVLPDVKTSVAMGAGRVPGHSSDYDAVLLAGESNARTIINLSNIDYMYDKDPRKFPDAKKFENISWADFNQIFPEAEWAPGGNWPFDPVAAKEAQKLNVEVVIMNGANLDNLKNYFDGKPFVGTTIK